jgi:DNA replication protein DnaC
MYVGQYMTCMELIQILRSTWRKDSEVSELRMLDRFAKIPLLVIDEVGVQYGTDSEQNHLFDVLDRRYREMMPTILLTNQDKDGFKTFVGERVYDRMTECARWVSFTWQSYRPQARKEMRDA